MRQIALISILCLILTGCASVVTFPDGKQITFQKGFGVRDFEAEYNDKEAKKEYKTKGTSTLKLPDLNLFSLPGLGK